MADKNGRPRRHHKKDISIRGATYDRLFDHAQENGRTPGSIVEDLVLAFLDAHTTTGGKR